MIIREFFRQREDNVNLYRTYSDEDMMIRQVETGNLYAEAIDVENAPYTYEETDIPIGSDDEVSDSDALRILLGGELGETEQSEAPEEEDNADIVDAG